MVAAWSTGTGNRQHDGRQSTTAETADPLAAGTVLVRAIRMESLENQVEPVLSADGDNKLSDLQQVDTLYLMGPQANAVSETFGLSEAQKKAYNTVMDKFNSLYAEKKNTVYERAKLNKR